MGDFTVARVDCVKPHHWMGVKVGLLRRKSDDRIRIVWRLSAFLLLLGASYWTWGLLYRTLFGVKIYSVLQALFMEDSFLIPVLFSVYLAVRYLDRRPFRSFGLTPTPARSGVLSLGAGFLVWHWPLRPASGSR